MDSLDQLKSKKILVIGDLIVDHYRIMEPTRLSPEAPVVIFSPQTDEWRLGGAANTAHNLESMGANVALGGVVGTDWTEINRQAGNGSALVHFPTHVVKCAGRRTTVKERIVTRRQQVARIDIQSREPIDRDTALAAASILVDCIADYDLLVFSDYDHGAMVPALTYPILRRALDLGRKVVVDSKAKDTLTKYKGVSVILPNNVEAKDIARSDSGEDEQIAKYLLNAMRLEAIGLTLGPKGIMLIESSAPNLVKMLPALSQKPEEVIDVTGAGDTVTAAVAAALALGWDYERSMRFANVAAGIVVRKMGVATATPEEIRQEARRENFDV